MEKGKGLVDGLQHLLADQTGGDEKYHPTCSLFPRLRGVQGGTRLFETSQSFACRKNIYKDIFSGCFHLF